ncbi:alpha amylase, catalytic region [Alkaliphilus metalliredigens QYMF]|uniref:Alpha amylase, catalytic region n=1 Tax=Alkaliphilus metalliredigens (strain QYMF) TaxID=293826 RepID=A6TSC6_ALKMQ|nr:glycoside hydrolase family 13 protein [Alkaliphilus metalliredigens]ABR49094.1 alpha amylase, catalytic region [Alkaliphilus metalliredigens QYMF]
MNELNVLHDSQKSYFRNPFGAAECGEKIKLRVKIDTMKNIEQVFLSIVDHNGGKREISMYQIETDNESHVFETEINCPEIPGLLWYQFKLIIQGEVIYYCNNDEKLGGQGMLKWHEGHSFQITVYKAGVEVPSWFRRAVMYQIFPDRFYEGETGTKNQHVKKNSFFYGSWEDKPMYIREAETNRIQRWEFFGGDLQGIIEKLNYLEELGITSIYLNPVFESPSNHRYDIGNYKKIDPLLGDSNIFERFCKEAEKRGIHIILDGVFSHTGSDSLYFNKEGNYQSLGAYQSKDSPYASWYQFDHFPDQYKSWWGIDTMPDVEEMDPSYLDYIIRDEDSVIKHWMKLGVKGWRLDVADELPSAFIKVLKKVLKETDPQAVLIGEVWEDATNKISHGEKREFLFGEELDSVMNYPLREALLDFFLTRGDGVTLQARLMKLYENYPKPYFYSLMNIIGSHDVPRALTALAYGDHSSITDEKEVAVKRLKLLSLFQMTFPGIPCIYYGDEAGAEGGNDPDNRRTYPWGSENEEILAWYKKITRIRRDHEVFVEGDWYSPYGDRDVYTFVRQKDGERAFVLFNRSNAEAYDLHLNNLEQLGNGVFKNLLISDDILEVIEGKARVRLEPLEGKVFYIKR